jgi:hypothetical protein
MLKYRPTFEISESTDRGYHRGRPVDHLDRRRGQGEGHRAVVHHRRQPQNARRARLARRWVGRDEFWETRAWIGRSPRLFETSRFESIDIDDMDEWIVAEAIAYHLRRRKVDS